MIAKLRQIWWAIQDLFEGKPLGGQMRSPDWREFRRIHIKKYCECCGKKGSLLKPLELHHIVPFHNDPSKECDPTNVITLCRPCHLEMGHLMNFKSHNKDVVSDSARMLEKIRNRPQICYT